MYMYYNRNLHVIQEKYSETSYSTTKPPKAYSQTILVRATGYLMWKGSEELAWNVLGLLWLVPNSDGVDMLSGWKPIVFLVLPFKVSSRLEKQAEEGKS